MVIKSGMYKSSAAGRPGERTLYGGASYLWVLDMDLASRHPSSTYNFEMGARFFRKLEHPCIKRRLVIALLRICKLCEAISFQQRNRKCSYMKTILLRMWWRWFMNRSGQECVTWPGETSETYLKVVWNPLFFIGQQPPAKRQWNILSLRPTNLKS
jgi:hypothetical protein